MRKRWFLIGMICCTLSLPLPDDSAAAAPAAAAISMTIGAADAYIDGKRIVLDQPPTLINNKTMVPLRFISDALGATLNWDDQTQRITISLNQTSIRLQINQPQAVVNGQQVVLDEPPAILNNTTVVPLRFVAEAFHKQVAYDEASKSISLSDLSAHTAPVKPAAKPPEKLPQMSLKEVTKQEDLNENRYMFYNYGPWNYGTKEISKILNIVADRIGNVYILRSRTYSSGDTFIITKYHQATGILKDICTINSNFNFEFKEKDGANTHKFSYKDFAPAKLYLGESDDKLYVMGSSDNDTVVKSVIYQIQPDVQMMTYQATKDTMNVGHNFMSTLDGKEFYYGDIFRNVIYKGEAGHESQSLASMPSEPTNEMVSTTYDGHIYVFDKMKQSLSRIDEKGLTLITSVHVDNLQNATVYNGTFYLSDRHTMYKLSTNGELTEYASLTGIRVDKLQQPYTQTEPPASVSIDSSLLLTVDGKGNIYFMPFVVYILNKIVIYPE